MEPNIVEWLLFGSTALVGCCAFWALLRIWSNPDAQNSDPKAHGVSGEQEKEGHDSTP